MDTETIATKHILLIEDDPRDVELTLFALEEHHLCNQVAVVCDGAEALDYLYCRAKFSARTGGLPVLVLLDNKMPKVGGLEVLKIMKADEHLKMIPVVVLTSSRETLDLVEFYKHGVNAYVVKPVEFSEFMAAVKQLGVFWGNVNEPPPPPGRAETSLPGSAAISRQEKELKNPASRPGVSTPFVTTTLPKAGSAEEELAQPTTPSRAKHVVAMMYEISPPHPAPGR